MHKYKELDDFANKVNKKLDLYFKNQIREASSKFPVAYFINNIIKEFIMRGGKRIRPFLMYSGYKCVGGKDDEKILNTSLCLELLQSFLLIHDDIVDKSDVRRGGPTVHKMIEKKYTNKLSPKEAKELGDFFAIYVGTHCFIDSYKILADAKFPDRNIKMAISGLCDVLRNALYGQVMDVLTGAKVFRVTEKEVNIIQELKTGKYTIEAPLHLGAILGNGSKRDLDTLGRYAKPLGQAFQIKDDIIGLFGDPRKTGKPNDSDIKTGKKTLLILKAIERASKSQKCVILKCLGNKNLKPKDIEKLKDIIILTGSLRYSELKMENLINKAKNVIRAAKFTPKGKALLIKIADFIGDRQI
ncbi:MAG: polyprenyl synthetase family protein [Candidatus Saganbacteria bacterium]|nr:polyprenyl synthetase family protein [Candidatus Saganbacteria bacterium]